jgi:hypothetical protein
MNRQPKQEDRLARGAAPAPFAARLHEALEATSGPPQRLRDGSLMFKCPAHQDRRPSLHVTDTASGHVLLCCFAGCTYETIRAAAGVPVRWSR